LHLTERAIPLLKPGQVLVRMAAAPVNPSDVVFTQGQYGIRKALPAVPGLEGSGVVIAASGGGYARFLNGRRVACSALADGDGTWAEYLVTNATQCVPLRAGVTLEQGATLFANPLSAWLLFEEATSGGHHAAISTAASGALGRMLVRLGQQHDYPIIHVVRRAEQVRLLQREGAREVLDSSSADFDAQLRERSRALGATIAFDAVSGPMTARLLAAMPRHSRVIVYGGLAAEAITLLPGEFVFRDGAVTGFWVSDRVRRMTRLRLAKAFYRLQGMLGGVLRTEIRQRLPLHAVPAAFADVSAGATRGKTLIVMGVGSENP
jgi:NADPH:quinone reductase-like Zn-dependent oxidoreductase